MMCARLWKRCSPQPRSANEIDRGLVAWCFVSRLGVDFHGLRRVPRMRRNLNLPPLAIIRMLRLVAQHVLAPQFVTNGRGGSRQFGGIADGDGASAGGFAD